MHLVEILPCVYLGGVQPFHVRSPGGTYYMIFISIQVEAWLVDLVPLLGDVVQEQI